MAIKDIQRRLISMGFPLPRFGADGDFGKETEDALARALDELQRLREATPETPQAPATINRKKFYDVIRGSGLFPAGLIQSQVDGLENLLNVWEEYCARDPLDYLAYNLGTAYHETGATMQPIKERGARSYFNKYEPGTKLGKILGNTKPGDGFRYRGEGHVQNTGRRNARFASDRLNQIFGMSIDLEANPDLRGDPKISALSLFLGNKEGWWTGKDLSDYIDGVDESDAEDLREFIEARRVVNGTDKAETIGRHALKFEAALRAAAA